MLFGDYNPGGKLANTWPRTVGQLPMNFPTKPNAQWESERNAAAPIGLLFPFGHGLSYTTFEYSNLRVEPMSRADFTTDGNIVVIVEIKNTGQRDGEEVAQLYMRDVISSVTTYEQNLVGFERVHLKAGETKAVKFIVVPEQLSLLNRDMKRVVEPGEFEFMVGSSSKDIKQRKSINVTEASK